MTAAGTVAAARARDSGRARRPDAARAYALCGPALLLFAGLVVLPLAMTVLLSFYDWGQYKGIVATFTLKNWADVATDGYFYGVFGRTLRVALAVTALSLALGVPEACILNRLGGAWRGACLLAVIGPLLVSVVARTLGWALVFGSTGLLARGAALVGLGPDGFDLMFTETGVVVALTHVLVPFVVLSVWAALQRLDPQVGNAALSLGASPATVWRRVILPQIMPGVLSGGVIVFSLAASAFATPAIIGGRRLKVAATLAYDEFLNTLNWPLGATVAVLLLLAIAAVVAGSNRLIEGRYAEVFE